MKRETLLMTVLVIMAMLFASCSNGLGEKTDEGGTSTQTVSVSLGVDFEGEAMQKTTGSNADLSGLTIWYKATPQWTQDYPIHGGTSGFVQIPNCTPPTPANLGNFTVGTWLFEVEVRKGGDVVYSGDTTYVIYTGNTTPTVTVTPDTGDDGWVAITVTVPTTGASEKLFLDYTGLESDTDVEMTRGAVVGNKTTFTYTVNDLTPGAYTFSFRYKDQSGTQINTGTAQAVNVFAGQESTITGIIDGKHWMLSTIIVKMPGFSTFTVATTPTPDVHSVAPNGTLNFSATATTISGNSPTYAWYINHADQSTSTNTFAFSQASPDLYEVTCVVSDGTDVTSSTSYYVEVGYSDITVNNSNPNGTVALTNPAGTIYGAGDWVPLTFTPASGYHIATLTVTGVDAEYVAFDTYSNTGSFKMPAAAVTVSATFEADAP